ncbi:hypothetical protein D3C85_797610 [compost metagenome]
MSQKGHVQVQFERVTGMTMPEWLAGNAGDFSLAAASEVIGYASPTALRDWVKAHMPALEFKARSSAFTDAQAREATARHKAGATWGELAAEYGRPRGGNLLRDQCRRRAAQAVQKYRIKWRQDGAWILGEVCDSKKEAEQRAEGNKQLQRTSDGYRIVRHK